MTKKTRLARVFARWPRTKGRGFIDDGIVDFKVWETTTPKVLFLMKEPNDPEGKKDWSLTRDFLSRGAVGADGNDYKRTWELTARWALGLTEGFLSWRDTKERKSEFASPDQRKHLLCKIAAMNLKKTGGGGATPPGSLASTVESEQEFIREEIAIIEPDLVICCGTGSEFGEILYPDLQWGEAENGVSWARGPGAGWKAIATYHPQARYPHNFLYTMLVNTAKEILATG